MPMTDLPAIDSSRRLPGPNRLFDRAGVIIEGSVTGDPAALVAGWRRHVGRMLEDLGLSDSTLAVITHAGGVSLGFSAPVDILLAATEVNEWAWWRAVEDQGGPQAEPRSLALERIGALIQEESNPAMAELARVARARGINFMHDLDSVTIGSGAGSVTWPLDAIPAIEAIDWGAVHDIPLALVTGSNGKTTTVRLLAAMMTEAGYVAGFTSTDGVFIGTERLLAGDYSGPDGARQLLRDKRVGAAVLETARGGILRRGLGVTRADVAVITNIAADHLGLSGVSDLEDIADAKAVVARALGTEGVLVVNAEDPLLWQRWNDADRRISWFGKADTSRPAAWEQDGTIHLAIGEETRNVAKVGEVPITFGGAARHNVSNALAATLAAVGLGLPFDAMQVALRKFGRAPSDNAGRANLYELGDVRVLLDYAHNPHGMDALATMVNAMPAERKLLLIGQAGDRSDDAIRDLARSAWAMRPDHVIIKEMAAYRRGRGPYDIPLVILDELRRLGLPERQAEFSPSELAGVERALAWSRPGDLLVLTVHAERGRVEDLLTRRVAAVARGGVEDARG